MPTGNLKAAFSLVLALASIGLLYARPAPASSAALSITDARARELVLAAADFLDTMYVEPEKGKRIAEELRRRSETGRYDGSSTISTLADRLTADLQEVGRDKHLSARFDPQASSAHGGMIRRQIGDAPPGGMGAPQVRVVRGEGPTDPVRAERDRRSNFGFHSVERLDGNVGYLELRELTSLRASRDTAAAAMAFLSNSDAVIIDLRNCPGGSADTVSFLASYFFGPGRHELFSRYDRPGDETRVEYTTEDLPGRRMADTDLWILVGPGTASAGESLAYLLQQFGRATVVGEGTAGAGYNVAMLPVGDGLVLGVSVAKPIHPKTGRGWEGEGVKPDVRVAAVDALSTAHSSALKKLLARAEEDRRKRELQWAVERVTPGPARRSAAELASFSGRYGERTVALEEGRLVCRAANGRARILDSLGKDAFTWDEQTRASFARDAAGRPAELVLERVDGTVERFPRQTETRTKETR
ncbi:MAG: S41 family peptidase [Acidobacteriota bacterium]|nr:S41 family peptidase [Acidobacteriota bacterium]